MIFAVTFQSGRLVGIKATEDSSAAQSFIDSTGDAVSGVVVTEAKHLRDVPAPIVVSIYNAITGRDTKKFESRSVGSDRTFEALRTMREGQEIRSSQNEAGPVEGGSQTQTEEEDMARQSSKTTKSTKKSRGERREASPKTKRGSPKGPRLLSPTGSAAILMAKADGTRTTEQLAAEIGTTRNNVRMHLKSLQARGATVTTTKEGNPKVSVPRGVEIVAAA